MNLRVAMDGRFLTSQVLRGMDRYVVGLVGALTGLGVRVTLLHRAGDPFCHDHLQGINCEVLALRSRRVVAWEQIAVPKVLRRGRFDIYHAPAERGVPYLSPCPVVMTYHSATAASYHDLIRRGLLEGKISDYLGRDWSVRPRSLWDHYHWWQVHRADHVITVSEFSKDEIVRLLRVPNEKVSVTPLAAAAEFAAPTKPTDELNAALARLGARRPYLLYVGGFEPHKNVGGLLDVVALVRRARPDLSLVAVGSSGVPEYLRAKVRRLGLDDAAVRFLACPSSQVVDLYDGCELVVSMSWRESFGLPVLEAMSRGKRVLASAWGAAPEVTGAAAGAFAILVDPRDAPAAAKAILRMLDDRAGEHASAGAAKERAATYSWSATARRTLEVYTRLAGVRAKLPDTMAVSQSDSR